MPTQKVFLTIATLTLAVFVGVLVLGPLQAVRADDCKDIDDLDDRLECYDEEKETTTKKLEDLRKEKDEVTQTIDGLLGQLTVTDAELVALQNQIAELVSRLDTINKNLVDKNEQLKDKVRFRNLVVRNFAKRGVLNELEVFVSTDRPADLTGFQYSAFSYMFERSLNQESKRLIEIINAEIKSFEEDKAEAQKLKVELEGASAHLVSVKNQLAVEKTAAEEDLGELAEQEASYEEKLAQISSKQSEILAAKAGADNSTVGDYDSPKPKVPDNPFSPAFGFFSYGAYTHRRGMSQYGAKARAESGQSYEDIIEFYYKEDVKEEDDFPDEICVEGYGDMDYSDYLYGIAEMPSSWDSEALKAQAVAARSYAYRRTKDGGCICTSTSCQVFLESKSDNPPSSWKDAVDDTEDEIIAGSLDAFGYGWYSSTTGGYIENVGWDGDWPDDSYENEADSPWFYWAWYSKSYRFDSDTCGRDHPWLKESEVADILNSWVVWTKGNDDDRDHITPVTTDCWGGDPWSHDEMADRADELGDKYTSVSSVSVDVLNSGQTGTITFGTNNGTKTINGTEFATVFNLRAPGYIAIRNNAQTGLPLIYDVQKK